MVNPLFTMVITTVVFSMMMRIPVKSFAVFLFAGLIPWTLFSSCLLQGGGAILENEALIKKIFIPRQTFVISKCISLLIDALLSFVVLFMIAAVIGAKISWALLFLPIAFVLVFLFAVGIALFMSVVCVYFRDAQYVMGIILQAGYYLTPIIYPLSIVPERFKWIFQWNPMYYFVQLFRSPIYEGVLPLTSTIFTTVILTTVVVIIGIAIFRKYDHTLIFRL